MTPTCLTDFAPGQCFSLEAPALSKDDITGYARQFDPQPFHLDEEAGKKSILGGLASSGWQSLAVIQTTFQRDLFAALPYGGLIGIPELRWKKPVYVDVPFAIAAEVADVSPTSDLPGYGTVSFAVTLSDRKSGDTLTTATLTYRIGGAA